MNLDASETRHLELIRFEHAAGEAFGCEAEEEHPASRFAVAPAAFAAATFATVMVATLSYWI